MEGLRAVRSVLGDWRCRRSPSSASSGLLGHHAGEGRPVTVMGLTPFVTDALRFRLRLSIPRPGVIAVILVGTGGMAVLAYPAAFAQDFSPTNFAPNSQWEIWSSVSYGPAENPQGTGIEPLIVASGNTTGTPGSSVLTVHTTGDLSVGDLVEVRGPGVDPSLGRAPMRVIALVPNTSITVRTPFGMTPRVSGPSTVTPIVIGNLAAEGQGNAADGWSKSLGMPVWRDNYPANVPRTAYFSLGASKDVGRVEYIETALRPRLWAGKQVVFGIYGYQKVRHGTGTWSIAYNDSIDGIRHCRQVPAEAAFQWSECTVNIPEAATYVYAEVQLNGSVGDTYYFADPVLTVGRKIGGVTSYTKPQEDFIPIVHVKAKSWINSTIIFPSFAGDGPSTCRYGFTIDPYADTGGAIAPTVAEARGQAEGLNKGHVIAGGAAVRIIAWYDRASAPDRSGSFVPQYVQNVKSFAYMNMPLNATDTSSDLRGSAFICSNVASDTWDNVSLEYDEFSLR